jgi:hypothetical protein
MVFEKYKENCPWRTMSLSMLTICSGNDKICKKENCGVIYWIDKLRKEEDD